MSEVQALFERFDVEADEIIDGIVIGKHGDEAAAMADGLAIRLVRWMLGNTVTDEQAGLIATSLVTELVTLRRNIHNEMIDQ